MKNRRTETVLAAVVLCLATSLTQAGDASPHKAGQAGAAQGEKVVAKKDESARLAVEPVDINSASKAELKKLPGIGDAEADRVIAGRPYLSKAHLQTRNIVSPMQYQALRELVVAKQKDAKFLKPVSK